jgi:hypothetical protein
LANLQSSEVYDEAYNLDMKISAALPRHADEQSKLRVGISQKGSFLRHNLGSPRTPEEGYVRTDQALNKAGAP